MANGDKIKPINKSQIQDNICNANNYQRINVYNIQRALTY